MSTIAVASARAGNVIGGGDWAADRLIPDAIRSCIAGNPVAIRNPTAVRPWQHVLEPLTGYLSLAERLWHGRAEFAEGWNFGPRPGRCHAGTCGRRSRHGIVGRRCVVADQRRRASSRSELLCGWIAPRREADSDGGRESIWTSRSVGPSSGTSAGPRETTPASCATSRSTVFSARIRRRNGLAQVPVLPKPADDHLRRSRRDAAVEQLPHAGSAGGDGAVLSAACLRLRRVPARAA